MALDDEVSLAAWEQMLVKGWRTVANGGSDLHGVQNTGGFAVGKPTTVVYARQLGKRAIISALKAGRCFITRSPNGVELYLGASRPGQQTFVGGDIYGDAGDPVTITARVRRAGGMRLIFVAQGGPIATIPVNSDDQTVSTTLPIPPGEILSATDVLTTGWGRYGAADKVVLVWPDGYRTWSAAGRAATTDLGRVLAQ